MAWYDTVERYWYEERPQLRHCQRCSLIAKPAGLPGKDRCPACWSMLDYQRVPWCEPPPGWTYDHANQRTVAPKFTPGVQPDGTIMFNGEPVIWAVPVRQSNPYSHGVITSLRVHLKTKKVLQRFLDAYRDKKIPAT